MSKGWVDALLLGFDRREAITIPSLPGPVQWDTFNAARQAMVPDFHNKHAAARYAPNARGLKGPPVAAE